MKATNNDSQRAALAMHLGRKVTVVDSRDGRAVHEGILSKLQADSYMLRDCPFHWSPSPFPLSDVVRVSISRTSVTINLDELTKA